MKHSYPHGLFLRLAWTLIILKITVDDTVTKKRMSGMFGGQDSSTRTTGQKNNNGVPTAED